MNRIIKSATDGYLEESLDLVEKVFTESEGEESGKLVRSLVEEIRNKRFYLPELDLVMVDEQNHVIGCAIFSRFHLEGKYEHQLLLLSPVAVKTDLQRQHIDNAGMGVAAHCLKGLEHSCADFGDLKIHAASVSLNNSVHM